MPPTHSGSQLHLDRPASRTNTVLHCIRLAHKTCLARHILTLFTVPLPVPVNTTRIHAQIPCKIVVCLQSVLCFLYPIRFPKLTFYFPTLLTLKQMTLNLSFKKNPSKSINDSMSKCGIVVEFELISSEIIFGHNWLENYDWLAYDRQQRNWLAS